MKISLLKILMGRQLPPWEIDSFEQGERVECPTNFDEVTIVDYSIRNGKYIREMVSESPSRYLVDTRVYNEEGLLESLEKVEKNKNRIKILYEPPGSLFGKKVI